MGRIAFFPSIFLDSWTYLTEMTKLTAQSNYTTNSSSLSFITPPPPSPLLPHSLLPRANANASRPMIPNSTRTRRSSSRSCVSPSGSLVSQTATARGCGGV